MSDMETFLYLLPSTSFAIVGISMLLNSFWRHNWKIRYFIRFKVIPFYDKLEREYGAKYPTIMDSIAHDTIGGLSPRNELETFLFVSDSSFVIVSSADPNFRIDIPFDTVLYQHSWMSAISKYDYTYSIKIRFIYNHKEYNLQFSTLEYNHKMDKKYGNRLNGLDLYNFMCNNFETNENYYGL